MLQAVIFDMDGVLIDSEPLWQEAIMRTFTPLGVRITRETARETLGFRLDEVVNHWHAKFPWDSVSKEDVEQRILSSVTELLRTRGMAKPGIDHAMRFFSSRGVRIGLASGSYYQIIHAVVDALAIRHHFEVIHSTEDELQGKPHPAVYLSAARKLGIDPSECLAIEDSYYGVLSAKTAGMQCLVIPDSSVPYDPRLSIGDVRLSSLADLNDETWERLSR